MGELQALSLRNEEDFIAGGRRHYDESSAEEKAQYQGKLINRLNELDQSVKPSKYFFRELAETWIRGTKSPGITDFFGTIGRGDSSVIIKVDTRGEVLSAFINAPHGQKIAEELLKNNRSLGVDVMGLKVPRTVLIYSDASKPIYFDGAVKIGSDGQVDGSSTRGALGAQFQNLLERWHEAGSWPRMYTKNLEGLVEPK